MKKSQLHGQIFIYILTIILTSFILIYGYNAVQNFKNRAEQVSCLKFKNDLSNAVESISSDFGSIIRKDLQLCAGYTQVCFVETFEKIIDRDNPDSNVALNPLIKDSISSNTGKNTFLVEKITIEQFYAGNISVEFDVFCVNASNNKISLKLEGKGDHVDLSQWT